MKFKSFLSPAMATHFNMFWFKSFSLVVLVLFVATSAFSCKKGGGDSGSDDVNEVIKGYAVGKVTDTKGKPVAGITVVLENQLVGGSAYLRGITDAKGNYKIKLDQVASYQASAECKMTLNGEEFKLFFHPDDTKLFGADGVVRNFQLKLSGPAPYAPDAYYGATIGISAELGSLIDDSENVEFTLTPIGNLIDGTPGSVITRRGGQPYTHGYGKLLDIPLARYRATAVHIKDGVRKPLKIAIRNSGLPLAESVVVDFKPETLWGKNSAYVSFDY